MKWASALSANGKAEKLSDAIEGCCKQIREQLNDSDPDLSIAFVAPDYIEEYAEIPSLIQKHLGAKTFIGCSAGGLIGGGHEIEHEAAIAITAAMLPEVKITPFHLESDDLPDLDDPPHKWEDLVKVQGEDDPNFILLPDPFSFKIDSLVRGLDFAFPRSVKIGGLASGASSAGMNALFLNDVVHRSGIVGVALHGNVVVETIVAQGCRPIGWPMRVTRCQRHLLYELDGQPAIYALNDVLESLEERERELAKHSLFIGVVMDEFKDEHKAGDFLIRNILGLEPNSGALLVGELLREERTVQFHLRDAETSADDLTLLLKRYRDSHVEQANGALLFSCLGRGEHLYGVANHDSDRFHEYLGPIPLGGFFCNGEIGPVGGTTFLHGYTSSFGLFRTRV